jgi:hypothetical protein
MTGQVWFRSVDGDGVWAPLNGVIADGFEFGPDTDAVDVPEPVTVPRRTSFTTSFTIAAPKTRREKRARNKLNLLWFGELPTYRRPRQLIHNGRKP